MLPPETSVDATVLLSTRAIRAFGDGLVSVILPAYLVLLGFSSARQGILITATLLGSAALTLIAGLRGSHLPRRRLLGWAALLMVATGVGFAGVTSFWPLVVIGCIGTLNPSGGDVSVFLPTEQALLPGTTSDASRTALFARYALIGSLVAAIGSLAAGLADIVAHHTSLSREASYRSVFLLYAGLALLALARYRRLSPAVEPVAGTTRVPLGPSRRVVLQLAALFSLDSFGGGFVVQSLVALWLFRRFDLSVGVAGAIFFWTGMLSAFSALVAVRIARRIGLVRTMVFTHLPANMFLALTPFMPNVWLAVTCLLCRSALSQMDVPVRTSYVMAVVTPAERPAAASVTNVPRSLASAAAPFLAGWLLDQSRFGWPLVIGGALKAVYDVLLLIRFRSVRPPEEL